MPEVSRARRHAVKINRNLTAYYGRELRDVPGHELEVAIMEQLDNIEHKLDRQYISRREVWLELETIIWEYEGEVTL